MNKKSWHQRSLSSQRENKFLIALQTISLGHLFVAGAVVYLLIVGVLMNHMTLLPTLDNINIRPNTSLLPQRWHGIQINNNIRQHFAADSKHKDEEGASACLLVNDENPRLPEWIAYHYHTIPLRSLTVAVDPASRLSPLDILRRWNDTGLMEMQLWNDDDYLYEIDDNGVKKRDITVTSDVYGHRVRQNHFINKCMADFKRRNKQWVLLIDVDEYMTFNRIDDINQEPDFPLEKAPDGIPTLMDWIWSKGSAGGYLEGWIDTLPSPTQISFEVLSALKIQPGGIVTDVDGNNSYYLRDDRAVRDLDALDEPPEPMPVLKYVMNNSDDNLCGEIFNDVYDDRWDKEWVCIEVDWDAPESEQKKTNILHGGYVIEDLQQRKYFMEKEQTLWPKRLTVNDAKEARERLPSVDGRKKILDVVKEELNRYGYDSIGPCITMPRLRYGSFEAPSKATTSVSPGEINPNDFVTLRYRWHAAKGTYAYGKTMIDVSKIPMEELQVEAENVHAPLCHYCHRQDYYYSPRYVLSPFRVNHYLDSFEAYTYRKDIRVELRQSEDRYNTLAEEGNHSMDTESSLWLQEFVQDMGSERAKMLLAGAGSFPRLDWNVSSLVR
mmetsp:Transcript_28889/g.45489  ORF Transcript_28889/g.45489 Transcript_28889/m.45489 type:complete len:609 (+) Transcript_28889:41-1867(+)